MTPAPAAFPSSSAPKGPAMARKPITSEVSGALWELNVAPGDDVETDQELLLIESMKMEIAVNAPCAGRVAEILVTKGDVISAGQTLMWIEA